MLDDLFKCVYVSMEIMFLELIDVIFSEWASIVCMFCYIVRFHSFFFLCACGCHPLKVSPLIYDCVRLCGHVCGLFPVSAGKHSHAGFSSDFCTHYVPSHFNMQHLSNIVWQNYCKHAQILWNKM